MQLNVVMSIKVQVFINKSGKNNDVNVFFNFQLTRRRNNLLYEVRQLKRQDKVAKFYTDENGGIKVLFKLGGRKERITSITNKVNSNIKTLNIHELKNRASNA